MAGRSLGLHASVVVDLEVTELVGALVSGDNAEILTHLLLLQVLLGQVLEVALGEVDLGLNDDVVHVLGDSDSVSEVAKLSLNLDALSEEIAEISEDDDVILDGELAVDSELVSRLLALSSLSTLFLCSLAPH